MAKAKRTIVAATLMGLGYMLFLLSIFLPLGGMPTPLAIFLGLIYSLLSGDLMPSQTSSDTVFLVFLLVALLTNLCVILTAFAMQRIRYEGKMCWFRSVMTVSAVLIISPFLIEIFTARSNAFLPFDFRDAGIGYHVWWLAQAVLAAGLWVQPSPPQAQQRPSCSLET